MGIAVAITPDGVRRPVHYSIAEDLGAIGATWGVEWCVVGLDRNWAYNPLCKIAGPYPALRPVLAIPATRGRRRFVGDHPIFCS